MAISEFIRNFTQFADRIHVHLALSAGAHGPHFVAALGYVMQNAGARPIMPIPLAVVLLQQGMHVRKRVRDSVFVRSAG